MTSRDDAREAARAMINQIPDTMEATRTALSLVGNLDDAPPPERFARLVGVLAMCVFHLDNRIEHLEGRPGVEPEQLMTLLSEFFGTGI